MYIKYVQVFVYEHAYMYVCMYMGMQPFNSIKHFQPQSKGNDGREKQLSWGKRRKRLL